ncbi:glycosyltransferase [Luteococcus peritonei]|uniref:Glycosyltransferase n=1 Tax=Luteococcus peritonei TaxID=88874 RepID=A0ABW4RSD5_9ACTN
MGRLGVVLVNYGSHALLADNLDPRLAEAGIQVVVTDNFTSEQELAALRALAEQRGWEVVALATNQGFGHGVNAGVARARELGCEAFVALNPDARVSIEVLQALHAAVEADHRALVAPRMDRSDGRKYFHGSMVDYRSGRTKGFWGPDQDSWRPWLTGACLALHDEAFTELGGFAGDYFLYWEDVDLTRRAAEAGMRLVLREDLVATHDEGGTQARTNDRALSSTYYYWNSRNRLRFAADHLGRADLARWIVRTPAESRQILLRGGRRQLLTSPRPLLATVRGSLAGLGLALPGLVRGPRRPAGERPPSAVLLAHPSPDLYGSDRVMLESVSAFTEAGTRVVVALPADGPLVPELERRGARVELVEMPVLRKSALSPTGLMALAATAARSLPPQLRLVRASGAEAVLVNTVTIPMWSLVARLARRPVAVHVHEAEAQASRAVNAVLYGSLLLATRVVANSRHTADVVAASYPLLARRTTVVHNGVVGPAGVQLAELGAGRARLLFVGRLSPRKGPDVAVRALADLVRGGVDAELALLGAVFPGYEWFETELRELVDSLGLGDRVHFLGFADEVWPALAECHVALVPSVLEESFGNTAVEALLAARPLVVSDHSGLAEATEGFQAVRRVPAGDPTALAGAVRELLADHPAAALAALADREGAARFSPQRYREGLRRAVGSLLR